MCLGRQNVDLGDIEADRQALIGLLERPCGLEMKIPRREMVHEIVREAMKALQTETCELELYSPRQTLEPVVERIESLVTGGPQETREGLAERRCSIESARALSGGMSETGEKG